MVVPVLFDAIPPATDLIRPQPVERAVRTGRKAEVGPREVHLLDRKRLVRRRPNPVAVIFDDGGTALFAHRSERDRAGEPGRPLRARYSRVFDRCRQCRHG